MHIENLVDYPAKSIIEADLVIVGGGPAGLVIASELSGAGLAIVIVESGLTEETPEHAALNRIESDGSPRGASAIQFRNRFHGPAIPSFDHAIQPFGVRSRALGGSARYWGGKTALFDESDFARRDWVPNSGWPILRTELTPFINRAACALNLGPLAEGDTFWDLLDPRIPRPPVGSGALQSFFWQFARTRGDRQRIFDFVEAFRGRTTDDVRLLAGATVTQLNTTRHGHFESLDVSTLEGARSSVVARRCVLAAGGIENPRLLLASNRKKPAGLGNDYDQVGRHLMDHPGTEIGSFRAEDLTAAGTLGFYTLRERDRLSVYSHGLTLSGDVRRQENLLNAALYVVPETADDDPVEALKRILRRQSENIAADLMAPIKQPGVLARSLAVGFLQSRRVPSALQARAMDLVAHFRPAFIARAFQAYGVPRKWSRLTIHAITEQAPDPESRITLSDECDPLGVPLARAHWIISDADRRTILRLAQILQAELKSLGLPTPDFADWIENERPEDAPLVDMAHIIGTTRMSESPRNGVVDTNCQVHGVPGLYVAGSSVFPTSGHANPTLMLTSLAIRLADRIQEDFAREATRSGSQRPLAPL